MKNILLTFLGFLTIFFVGCKKPGANLDYFDDFYTVIKWSEDFNIQLPDKVLSDYEDSLFYKSNKEVDSLVFLYQSSIKTYLPALKYACSYIANQSKYEEVISSLNATSLNRFTMRRKKPFFIYNIGFYLETPRSFKIKEKEVRQWIVKSDYSRIRTIQPAVNSSTYYIKKIKENESLNWTKISQDFFRLIPSKYMEHNIEPYLPAIKAIEKAYDTSLVSISKPRRIKLKLFSGNPWIYVYEFNSSFADTDEGVLDITDQTAYCLKENILKNLSFIGHLKEPVAGVVFEMKLKQPKVKTDYTGNKLIDALQLVAGIASEFHYKYVRSYFSSDLISSLYEGETSVKSAVCKSTFIFDNKTLSPEEVADSVSTWKLVESWSKRWFL